MILMYSFLFCKSYNFCIKVFKEKEFPHAFASFIVSMTFVTNVYVLLSLIEYLMLPLEIKFYEQYFGYFSLASLFIVFTCVSYKKKYIRILEYCKRIPEKKVKSLRIYSIIYLILLFIGFFLMGYLIRKYNIEHNF